MTEQLNRTELVVAIVYKSVKCLVQVCTFKMVAITITVNVVPRCLDLKSAFLPSGLSEPYPVDVAPSLLNQRLICTELRQDF